MSKKIINEVTNKKNAINKIKIAYKKYKSFIYFDKNLAIQRENILEFETTGMEIEEKIEEIYEMLNEANNTVWNKYKSQLLESISVNIFPKNIGKDKSDKNKIVLSNDRNENPEIRDIENLQVFLNANVPVHLIGVLWILYIGKYIDENFYKHSHGNRLIQEEYIYNCNSPYLFKPYFKEYERWRDKALEKAEQIYDDEKDCMFLTLDITRFYYSIDFKKAMFNIFLENDIIKNKIKNEIFYKRINMFVFDVINKYNKILPKEFKKDNVSNDKNLNKNTLPIGFMPSNILANWYLDSLDKAIINNINPIYYGRYVDDIIIVDKIEKNSKIQNLDNISGKYEFLNVYLGDIVAKLGDEIYINNSKGKANEGKSKLYIKESKANIVYIKANRTKGIIEKLRHNIRKNSSEFRMLPEDKDILGHGYNKIYSLLDNENETKFRNIKDVEVNKYELSKFIGKQLTVGAIINDSVEAKFYNDLNKIFTKKVIIDNYNTWESVLTLCIINNRIDKFYEFVNLINDAIDNINVSEILFKDDYLNKKCYDVIFSLKSHLIAVVSRASSLMWGQNSCSLIEKIAMILQPKDILKCEDIAIKIKNTRSKLVLTRMVNKLYIPIFIDYFIKNKVNILEETDEDIILLNDIWSSLDGYAKLNGEIELSGILFNDSKLEYSYYPYKIGLEDLYRQFVIRNIYKGKPIEEFEENDQKSNDEKKSITEKLIEIYKKLNYGGNNTKLNIEIKNIPGVITSNFINTGTISNNFINIGNNKKHKIKIAVGNASLKIEDFHSVFKENPNRSLKRYKQIVSLINQSIKEKVDLLILPENYIPFEWLECIERKCKNEQIALITGVEHIKYESSSSRGIKKGVHNLIATMLPYKIDEHKYIYTNIRNKIHYSPDEEIAIKDYGYEPIRGKEINMFVWNDIWFPVYCCFEIASIKIRSSFLSLLDLVVAVEWNKDVEYFSNIIDSLSRDMHGYCIQVNSAHYGDSCIVKPAHSYCSSIVRTTGGVNNAILVGEVDISKLRDFQTLGYVQQKIDDSFKRTPPGFDKDIVIDKINNRLFKKL